MAWGNESQKVGRCNTFPVFTGAINPQVWGPKLLTMARGMRYENRYKRLHSISLPEATDCPLSAFHSDLLADRFWPPAAGLACATALDPQRPVEPAVSPPSNLN
jgi:hypothetical protein